MTKEEINKVILEFNNDGDPELDIVDLRKNVRNVLKYIPNIENIVQEIWGLVSIYIGDTKILIDDTTITVLSNNITCCYDSKDPRIIRIIQEECTKPQN